MNNFLLSSETLDYFLANLDLEIQATVVEHLEDFVSVFYQKLRPPLPEHVVSGAGLTAADDCYYLS